MTSQLFELVPSYGQGERIRVAIREFHPQDLDQVLNVFREGMLRAVDETHEQFPLWEGLAQGATVDLPDIHSAYVKPGGNFWVAVIQHGDGEEVVGHVGLQRSSASGSDARLRRMSVKQEYRRFGVGRVLVQELERWASASDITSLNLSSSPLTSGFYASLGYKETHTTVWSEDPYFELVHFVKNV